ncbi:methyltransferase domain-containing protein [Alteromonas sp. ASW11-36]|uniref:tRNA 5-carboxymethoxyuridine methyltransferase n=1 Tax=Alteromonas arenosi TaxID=3055817 RepID=A0ABT7SYE6_9ALTE|nr:methyltransferase domain-containing protein [Alteromonas sp. ASW11-36]MDM7861034.1 methyltransferase domain-containing protein [Alteromonas sp. ASW11-36]
MSKSDQSFDGIANKFERNIYGSSKGKIRSAVLAAHLRPFLDSPKPLDVIDVGGGTGEMAAFALNAGHRVLLNDISADAIALAKAKHAGSTRIAFAVGDLQALQSAPVDRVFCHAVLEWCAKPFSVIDKCISLLKSDGVLSLSFFNHNAALFSNALYGNFDLIEQGLVTKNRVRLNPNNPQKPEAIINYLQSQGLSIELTAGVRCFHDYMRDRDHWESKYNDILAMELAYSTQDPFKWLGRYFHVIAKR